MSWSDLQAVFAVEFAVEIEAVASRETRSVIRERLAGLGAAGRELLREALADSQTVASV